MGPELMLATTIAGGAVSAFGKIQEGEAAASAANYQAQVARNNAQIAQQNAEYASQAGEVEAQKAGLEARAGLGSIRAAQAASNVSLTSPSLQNVYAGSEQLYRLDTANIIQNAALRARSYQAKGAEYLAEADLQTSRARDAKSAGYIGALGSTLTTVGNFSEKWEKFKPLTATKPFYTGDA